MLAAALRGGAIPCHMTASNENGRNETTNSTAPCPSVSIWILLALLIAFLHKFVAAGLFFSGLAYFGFGAAAAALSLSHPAVVGRRGGDAESPFLPSFLPSIVALCCARASIHTKTAQAARSLP